MRSIKNDNQIMRALNISEISRVICETNMGTLKLRLRKGEQEYKLTLDSVDLPKDINKEVMELLFPISAKQDIYPAGLVSGRAIPKELLDSKIKPEYVVKSENIKTNKDGSLSVDYKDIKKKSGRPVVTKKK